MGVFAAQGQIIVPVFALRHEPNRREVLVFQQFCHTRAGGMTCLVVVEAEVHLCHLWELPQGLHQRDGRYSAAAHIVVSLPIFRVQGDVGEQVDGSLKDIERVIPAEAVEAMLGVTALDIAPIALAYGVQATLVPMTGNAVFIDSDKHGVVVFPGPILKGLGGSGVFSLAAG